MLDVAYRPVGAPDRDPVLPRNPRRLKAFMYACARYSARKAGMVDKVVSPKPAANRAQRRAAKKKAR